MTCSGDSDYCEELIEAAREADLFVCESAFPDDFKVPGHMTPSLAGRIAQGGPDQASGADPFISALR